MVDYIKRLLLGIIMMVIITILIIGSKQSIAKAEGMELSWIWPADGVITDVFGTRNGQHKGIDIADVTGTPVLSVDDGRVSKSYYSDTYGHVVFIKHETGYETVYAHLSKREVQEGQMVTKGQKIGLMGSTGESSGPHLHFEIHQNEWTETKENSIDPTKIFGIGEIGQHVSAGPMPAKAIEVGKTLSDHSVKYTVRTGDTLWGIANKYDTTVYDIKKLNDLQSEIIVPGQQLVVEQ